MHGCMLFCIWCGGVFLRPSLLSPFLLHLNHLTIRRHPSSFSSFPPFPQSFSSSRHLLPLSLLASIHLWGKKRKIGYSTQGKKIAEAEEEKEEDMGQKLRGRERKESLSWLRLTLLGEKVFPLFFLFFSSVLVVGRLFSVLIRRQRKRERKGKMVH